MQEKLSPWQTTWLHQVSGKCYTYQYYTYHRWHWLCNKWYLVPDGLAPNCWCRATYLPIVGKCWHKFCTPASLPSWELCGPSAIGNWNCGRDYLRWRSGTLNRTSTHILDKWKFQVFYLGMDHWPWCTWPSWWFLQYYAPPFPQWGGFPPWCDNLWCLHGHTWRKGPLDIDWSFLQRFLKIALCMPHHTSTCHTYTYIYYFTLLFGVILVLDGHQEIFDGVASLEMDLDCHFATMTDT